MSPFDFVKSVTLQKNYMMNEPNAEKAYIPFLINKTLSFNVETIMHANEMNLNYGLDKKLQYDYYFYTFPKKKYYNSWFKKKENADLNLIRQYYGYNIQKAKEALTILTDEQLEIIRKKFEQGGIKR